MGNTVTWYRLRMPCPVAGCRNQKNVILDWVCAQDHDTMYICEEGVLACYTERHKDPIINWKFDCGDRSENGPHHSNHYQSADLSGFTHALSISVPYLEIAEIEWQTKLLSNIRRQYGK